MTPSAWIEQAQKPACVCDMDASEMVHPDAFVAWGIQIIQDQAKQIQLLQEAVDKWQDHVRAERDKASTLTEEERKARNTAELRPIPAVAL